ncbi:MAG: type II toxin-antitoxin system ParD family antitoxin [Rhodobacteraceae bacterium]|nr:type II toxin-antitoxin system ParD family antitoxin [Paracoccaceae bacterium]
MTVKSSISLTDQQDAFARRLVAEGRYSSLSAVIQHGLELVQRESDGTDALRALLDQRRQGPFISHDELVAQVDKMLADKRRDRGLAD